MALAVELVEVKTKCMVKLAVFLENWPCETRLHGSLAKPLIQDNFNIAPYIFSADTHACHLELNL